VLYTAGQAVVQLVEALLYKTEGRGFDSFCYVLLNIEVVYTVYSFLNESESSERVLAECSLRYVGFFIVVK